MKGPYYIQYSHLRNMALLSHALDYQFESLFNEVRICGSSERITKAYNQLFHTHLLSLAVSIRTAMRNHHEYINERNGVMNCGMFEDQGPRKNGGFAIKDVCDKIIHADEIIKHPEPHLKGACCTLRGSYKNKKWEFHFSPQIFCEHFLMILDMLENKAK